MRDGGEPVSDTHWRDLNPTPDIPPGSFRDHCTDTIPCRLSLFILLILYKKWKIRWR